jgi:hypothetical protein
MKLNLRTALASGVLALAVTGLAALPATAASAATTAPAAPAAHTVQASDVGTLTSEVTGTYTDATGGVGHFTGTFVPSQFAANGDQLSTTGLLSGTMTDSQGNATPVAPQSQQFAVTDALPGLSCQVLDLNLAPLDLNLLGLVVHLDRVHLNITAVPGAGNLLGNLLCAVTNLLNGTGTLDQIVLLLNQILGLLNL